MRWTKPKVHATRTVVHNDKDELLCVMVEPWGEDYWASKGERLTFTGLVSDGEVIELVAWDGGVSVWLADANEVQVTSNLAGTIECGHQRPSGRGEPPEAKTAPSP
jgi:hypothetical protein